MILPCLCTTLNNTAFILLLSFPPPLISPFLPLVARPFPRGPGDVIGDCKVQFLDEIYQVEKPGARALSAADGQFKRMQEHTHKICPYRFFFFSQTAMQQN